MKLQNLLAFIIAIFLSFNTFADNSCNAFLTLGIYNIAQSGTDADQQLAKNAAFCAAEYKPASEQAPLIEAAYKLLSGSSSSQINETQKRLCDGFGSDIYLKKASTFAQNIYQDALNGWDNCQNLNKKGIDFTMQSSPKLQNVTVTFSTNLGNPEKFMGLMQPSSGHSICKAVLPSRNGSPNSKMIAVDETTSQSFDATNKFTITCSRQMQKDSNGDSFSEAQTLVFNTSKGAYQVNFEPIGELSRMSVDEITQKVQQQVNSNKFIENINTITCLKSPQLTFTLAPDTPSVIDLCTINTPVKGVVLLDMMFNISGSSCVYFLAIDGNRVSSPAVTTDSGSDSGNISQATMLLAGNHSISVQAFSGAGTRECKTSDISLNGLFIPKE